MIASQLQKAWNTFFFKPTDSSAIAIFRILLGSLVVGNGIVLGPHLLDWYGQKGVLSFATSQLLNGRHRMNLWALLPPGDSWTIGVFCIHMLAAFFLTLGLFTRLSAFTVFLTLVAFLHRNILHLNSGDTLIRILCFLLIFSQAGSALSVDWIWRVLRGKASVNPQKTSPWAQRMMQLELSMVYLFTVMWKFQGAKWRNGTAVYYTSRIEDFQRFPVPWIFENLLTIKFATWSTLALELAMGTLIWVPKLRPYLLVSAVLFHLTLDYSMNIPFFQWVMLSTLILFVEPERLHAWKEKLGQLSEKRLGAPAAVFYDGDCGFCERATQILHHLDILGRLHFLNFRQNILTTPYHDFNSVRAEKEIALYTQSGRWLHGYAASRHIACRVPLLWPFAWTMYLPGAAFVGQKVYAWVAKNRLLFSSESCSAEASLPLSNEDLIAS